MTPMTAPTLLCPEYMMAYRSARPINYFGFQEERNRQIVQRYWGRFEQSDGRTLRFAQHRLLCVEDREYLLIIVVLFGPTQRLDALNEDLAV